MRSSRPSSCCLTMRARAAAVCSPWPGRPASASRRCSPTPRSRRAACTCSGPAGRSPRLRSRSPAWPGPPRPAPALGSAPAPRPAPSAPGRFAVGAATLSLLAAYSEETPVAVLVDDAHWLDGSRADAMLFAFRRLVADPVAVVLSVREGEPSLLDGADVPTLRLAGLDRASAGELLKRQADEPLSRELADRLHRETGGNPLALLELGQERQLLAGLPPGAPLAAGTSVARVYLQRSRSLPARTRAALVLASALDGGDVPVLGRAAPMLEL